MAMFRAQRGLTLLPFHVEGQVRGISLLSPGESVKCNLVRDHANEIRWSCLGIGGKTSLMSTIIPQSSCKNETVDSAERRCTSS